MHSLPEWAQVAALLTAGAFVPLVWFLFGKLAVGYVREGSR